jgi:hypothetical protein
MDSRRGIGEVVGSLSMLAVTLALLGGASAVALLSIQSATSLLESRSAQQQRLAGTLVTVVGSQENQTADYVWLYDYGWVSSAVQDVYLDGAGVNWTSDCGSDWAHSLCVVVLPALSHGQVTVVIGGESVVASV